MKSKFFRILGVVTTVAMLAGVLTVAPALGMSTPTVALTTGPVALAPNNVAGVISNANVYTITFTAGVAVPAGGKINIAFPATTKVSTLVAAADVTIEALAGIGGGPIALINPVYAVTGTYPAAQTLSITVPAGGLGAGSLVGIVLGTTNGILNPTAAGSYNLTVATTTAAAVTIEAATTSAAYTITNPIIGALPGIVKLYNANSIMLWQSNAAGAIATAVGMVGATGQVIELGPGLYVEGAITIPAIADTLTIKASGAKADTIVPAAWTVNAASVKFMGLTLKPPAAGNTVIAVGATGNKFTVDGCDFVKYGDATGVTPETFINYGNTTAAGTGTITNCTFDGTLGAAAENLVIVGAGSNGLTITKNTFKLDLNAAYASDWGVVVNDDATITENTFTGYVNFGKGVQIAGANTFYVLIQKNTFTGVKVALEFNNGNAWGDFLNNTVDASGYYSATTPALNDYPFRILNDDGLFIVQNKVTNSKYYLAYFNYDCQTGMNFNEFTGNAYGIYNNDNDCGVDATHNWWGAATGPVAGSQYGDVWTDFYLGAVPSNAQVKYGEHTLNGKTTSGVDVQTLDGNGVPQDSYLIGSASYATNPGAIAPPSTLKVGKYFDVYIDNDWGANSARIKFYGSVNDFSEVWFYNSLTSAWEKCTDQYVVKTGGFVIVEIGWWTVPDWTQVLGLPFVLVEAPPAAPIGTPVTQMPTLGAVDVPVDTTFTWPAVTGAVSYVFELAEETGQTDKFYLKDEVGGPTVNAYKLVDSLKYDTQYWWRVQAVNSLGVKSTWTTTFFTTEKEPVVVEPTPPVIIEQQEPPVITLEIPPDTVEKVQPIPSYLLWAVIAVGAVLVIVVIVLIVRTRRIS